MDGKMVSWKLFPVRDCFHSHFYHSCHFHHHLFLFSLKSYLHCLSYRYQVCQIMTLPNSLSGKGRTYKTNWGGLAPYGQTVGSSLRTPWPAKPAIKMDSAKSQLDELCVDHLGLLLYFMEYSVHFYPLKMMLKYSLRTIHGR